MRIETVGKKHYAFGLTWVGVARKPTKAVVATQRRAHKASNASTFYTCVCKKNGTFVLGTGVTATRVRGKVYSYAASLAKRQPDGLYVVRVDDTNLWFVLIRDGLVIPETDVIGPAEKVLESVHFYRQTLDLDADTIFAGEDVRLDDAQSFDAAAAVQGMRDPVPLSAVTGRGPVMLLAGVATFAILGVGGYKLYKKHQAAQAEQALTAQQRAQVIAAYHGAAQAALAGYAQDPRWVAQAWQMASLRLTPFLAGWTLQKVDCTPAGCDGHYVHGSSLAAYAIAPFQARFAHVSIHPDVNSLQVHLPLTTPLRVVDDALLHAPSPARAPAMVDWIGLASLHITGLRDRPAGVARNIAAAAGATAVGYPAFMVESITLKGRAPAVVSLPSLLRWATPAGFRVTHFTVMTGLDNDSTASWDATILRYHG